MKLIPLFFAIAFVGTISSCDAAHAFSINESQQQYDDRLDYESIKQEACDLLNCPSMGGLHIDEVKTQGAHIASVQASVKFYF